MKRRSLLLGGACALTLAGVAKSLRQSPFFHGDVQTGRFHEKEFFEPESEEVGEVVMGKEFGSKSNYTAGKNNSDYLPVGF